MAAPAGLYDVINRRRDVRAEFTGAPVPVPVLTRILQEAVAFQQPKRAGSFRPKLRYAHQGGQNPPVIVIHGNAVEHVTDVYKRYLESRFREHFKLVGTPLRIELRASRNPFTEKDS